MVKWKPIEKYLLLLTACKTQLIRQDFLRREIIVSLSVMLYRIVFGI